MNRRHFLQTAALLGASVPAFAQAGPKRKILKGIMWGTVGVPGSVMQKMEAVKAAGFPRLALWGTALFFALIHFNLATFLPLLLLALVLTWLYEKTGNLLAPIAAHAAFNALQFAIFYLLPVATEKYEWLRRLGGGG